MFEGTKGSVCFFLHYIDMKVIFDGFFESWPTGPEKHFLNWVWFGFFQFIVVSKSDASEVGGATFKSEKSSSGFLFVGKTRLVFDPSD